MKRITNIRRQKGYALLTSLAVTVLGLAITSAISAQVNIERKKSEREILVTKSLDALSIFSEGAIEASREDIEGLKDVSSLQDLGFIRDGFDDKFGMGQKLVANYVRDRSNPKKVDVLIYPTGDIESKLDISRRHFSTNVMESFQLDDEDFDALSYTSGVANNGVLNGIDLRSRYGFNEQGFTPVVLIEAPRQLVWWRFDLSPKPPTSEIPAFLDEELMDSKAIANLVPAFSRTIYNLGESYCPPDGTDGVVRVKYGESYQNVLRNVSIDDVETLCVETFREEIDPEATATVSAQILSGISTPVYPPFSSSHAGKCVAKYVDYSNPSPSGEALCFDTLGTFISPSQISGFDSFAVFDGWNTAQDDYRAKNAFNDAYKGGQIDQKVPSIIVINTLTLPIDSRYINLYSVAGQLVTQSGGAPSPFWASQNQISHFFETGIEVDSNRRRSTTTSVSYSGLGGAMESVDIVF